MHLNKSLTAGKTMLVTTELSALRGVGICHSQTFQRDAKELEDQKFSNANVFNAPARYFECNREHTLESNLRSEQDNTNNVISKHFTFRFYKA